jgi:hypothetical protein
MDNADWNAGQYYPSLTATAYFTDTTAAQSLASSDFTLASTSYTTGFWVGCAHTFNKITIYDVNATNTAVNPIYEYYGRASSAGATGWQSLTPVNTPTWTAVGNKEIEFNFPIDSNTQEILMDRTPSLNSSIGGVYCVRTTMSMTMTTTFSMTCGYVKAEHSQYLTQILLNDRPDVVSTHKSHLLMGSGNWMRVSPYSTLKGWREADKEYFSEGGTIQAIVPHLDYAAIVLDNAIYGLYGNSWQNWSTKLLIGNKGTINKRSAVVVNEELYFVARDGIYGWNGSRLLKLSKHIQTYFDTLTITDACAVSLKGEYWVAFPTNGSLLLFDPDTIRIDDVGDGRVSFYRFPTGYTVNQFIPYFGSGDTGVVRVLANVATIPRMDTIETDNFDKITASSTITMEFRTKDYEFGNSQQNKLFRRLKMSINKASAAGGQSWTLKHYANNQGGESTASVAFTVATGTGVDTIFQGIPPGIDGYTYGIYLKHDSQYDAHFLGFGVEVEKRKY